MAGIGYLLYLLLWIFRTMKTSKKGMLVVAGFLMASAFALAAWMFMPFAASSTQVEYVVEPGQSLRNIADILKESKVINSAFALRLYMRITKTARHIQSGRCTFVTGEGVVAAAYHLTHAQPIEIEVTIPEGLTIEQSAGCIKRQIQLDSVLFVKLCLNPATVGVQGVNASSLEGYLFPSTYRFAPGVSAGQIVQRMVSEFFVKYGTLIPDPSMTSRYSTHQIVTLASIVEKEATISGEQARIAGVFANRLRKGIPLGADPTVRFIYKKFYGDLRVSELNSDSPYNTRRFSGLPPGPICSPGAGALQAACAPLATNDLFFVARWDGSGAHDFSTTNEEHNRKKFKIRQENEQRKRVVPRKE